MKVGRPPMWTDPESFSNSVEEYFEDKEITHTWTGLALHLGFESRKSLWEYGEKPEFSNSVKRALLRIEEIYERNLFNKNAAGPIFALKNFGWRDTKEIKHDIPKGFLNIDPLDTPNTSAPEDSQP